MLPCSIIFIQTLSMKIRALHFVLEYKSILRLTLMEAEFGWDNFKSTSKTVMMLWSTYRIQCVLAIVIIAMLHRSYAGEWLHFCLPFFLFHLPLSLQWRWFIIRCDAFCLPIFVLACSHKYFIELNWIIRFYWWFADKGYLPRESLTNL